MIADSGGLAMGAGAADDVGDAGVYVVSGGTASASEPNTSGSAVDGAKVAFDTIVASGATESPADTAAGGTELVSSGAEDFGAQIAAGGITISAGVVVTVADVVTGGEMGGGLAVDGAEPFSARISSASAELAPVPAWAAAATTDLLAGTTLTVAGGGAAGATLSASSTNKVPTEGIEFGAAGKDDTMNMRSGDVVQDTVVGGGNVVGS